MTFRARIGGAGARRLSLYSTIFLTQLGVSVAVPILPDLRDEFGVSVTAVSLTIALWGLARLVFDLPAGSLTDRFSTGRMLFAGIVMLIVGALTSAFAPTFEIMLIGRVVSGAGAAVQAITLTMELLSLSTAANRGRVLGIYQAALQAGASLSPVVAGFASQLFGWRAAFLVAGAGAVSGLVVLVATRRSSVPVAPRGGAEAEVPHQVRRSPVWLDLLLANVATFVLFFVTGGVFSNVMPLYGDGLGLDAAGIGIILGIATLLRVVVSVVGSVVSDRHGRHGVMLLGFVLTFFSLLTFPLATNILAFTALAWIASIGRVGNTMPITMLSDRLPEKDQRIWISRNRFVADLALVVSPIILGIVVDLAGFGAAFYLASMMVAGVIILMLVEWRAHRSNAPTAPARR